MMTISLPLSPPHLPVPFAPAISHPCTPAVSINYGLLNAKVSYRPLKWLDVFVKGENLTGKSYETVYEYPMPGVTVFGGVNIKVGSE